MHYYELDARISDLQRSVYEPRYIFSLLAAMFVSIEIFPPAPAPATRDKNIKASSKMLSNGKHWPEMVHTLPCINATALPSCRPPYNTQQRGSFLIHMRDEKSKGLASPSLHRSPIRPIHLTGLSHWVPLPLKTYLLIYFGCRCHLPAARR